MDLRETAAVAVIAGGIFFTGAATANAVHGEPAQPQSVTVQAPAPQVVSVQAPAPRVVSVPEVPAGDVTWPWVVTHNELGTFSWQVNAMGDKVLVFCPAGWGDVACGA
jgi:hypothetical protein